MRDAIVVGCGILGATVVKALQEQGLDVLALDDRREMAGTPPSGGHCKPSWFSGMKKEEYEPAMELLTRLWDMSVSDFLLWPTRIKVQVWRVDTDVVVQLPCTQATVTDVNQLHNYPAVSWVLPDGTAESDRCRLLVLCTGAWADELVPSCQLVQKQGVSFRFEGQVQPFIKPWAPYKQVVTHQQGPNEIWVGDGSAILPANWADRSTKCLTRCRNNLGPKFSGRMPLRTITGIRPYCKNHGSDPCLLERLGPRAWLATGAGKSGTIAGGWVAWRIASELPS